MSLLEIKNVTRGFGPPADRTDVLRNINLQVNEGEFVVIVGYSGAGKSTLMNLLAGLVPPEEGQILLNGQPVTGPGPDRGVIFQNYSLLPWMTVLDNVLLAVDQVFPQWTLGERRDHAMNYLTMVNLAPAVYKRPAQLSGGMRQRVAVARALAMQPKILLMDEPFGALDALTRGTLQDEVIKIWEQERKTVVMITNDMDEGILMADRIIALSGGPGATLGPEFKIDIPRPRDRKAINHHPDFKRIRSGLMGYLLGEGAPRRHKIAKRPGIAMASATLDAAVGGTSTVRVIKPTALTGPHSTPLVDMSAKLS